MAFELQVKIMNIESTLVHRTHITFGFVRRIVRTEQRKRSLINVEYRHRCGLKINPPPQRQDSGTHSMHTVYVQVETVENKVE